MKMTMKAAFYRDLQESDQQSTKNVLFLHLHPGASEQNIRELFSKAYRNAPLIVFIDEIAAIAAKGYNLQREMERQIVSQLLTCMDESHRRGYVLVIGATNMPDAVIFKKQALPLEHGRN
ncbi:cell division control protein 48 homolog C-like [Tripterygium wilfordii]|uniref:cell division control protein 48 homolog C-like n=1 Tax=Tripterygium wilfordii TaxID=458696 RepID=UPI0018F83FF2|nr:cell division control protein 48 homolog C-like [Tripterygium wilfordii]